MPKKPPKEQPESPALADALEALGKRKGPPSDDDKPPLETFPGRKARKLPGQLELGE